MFRKWPIPAEELPQIFHMKQSKGANKPSLEAFFLPLGGILSGENSWVKIAALIQREELETAYAAMPFSAAILFSMALGILITKERIYLADEELVEQIKENPCPQFFLDLEAFQCSAPFDPSIMVYFLKRLPASAVKLRWHLMVGSFMGSV